MKVTRKTQVAPMAMAMRIAPDNSALWVLTRESRKLVRLDLESLRTNAQISLPLEPFDFDLSRFQTFAPLALGRPDP